MNRLKNDTYNVKFSKDFVNIKNDLLLLPLVRWILLSF